jgi:hypothetical protein
MPDPQPPTDFIEWPYQRLARLHWTREERRRQAEALEQLQSV